jgi:hypothetical protein
MTHLPSKHKSDLGRAISRQSQVMFAGTSNVDWAMRHTGEHWLCTLLIVHQ